MHITSIIQSLMCVQEREREREWEREKRSIHFFIIKKFLHFYFFLLYLKICCCCVHHHRHSFFFSFLIFTFNATTKTRIKKHKLKFNTITTYSSYFVCRSQMCSTQAERALLCQNCFFQSWSNVINTGNVCLCIHIWNRLFSLLLKFFFVSVLGVNRMQIENIFACVCVYANISNPYGR